MKKEMKMKAKITTGTVIGDSVVAFCHNADGCGYPDPGCNRTGAGNRHFRPVYVRKPSRDSH